MLVSLAAPLFLFDSLEILLLYLIKILDFFLFVFLQFGTSVSAFFVSLTGVCTQPDFSSFFTVV